MPRGKRAATGTRGHGEDAAQKRGGPEAGSEGESVDA